MSVRGDDVVAKAREWLGTPFHHQARLKGVGVDCAGLLIGVARELGLSAYDIDGYPRQPDGSALQAECDRELKRVPLGEAAPGDVLLLRMGRAPQHLAIITAMTADGRVGAMVHSFAELPSRCVEHTLDERWRKRIVCVYRLPGVG